MGEQVGRAFRQRQRRGGKEEQAPVVCLEEGRVGSGMHLQGCIGRTLTAAEEFDFSCKEWGLIEAGDWFNPNCFLERHHVGSSEAGA